RPAKRRRVILSSDDEEDNEDENLLTIRTPSPAQDKILTSTPMAAELSTPKSVRPLRPLKECSTPLSTAQAESFIDSFRVCEDDLNVSAASVDTLDRTIYRVESSSHKSTKEDELAMVEEAKFPHETFSFLKPENIRDAQGRRPGEDDYDPTTLYVPADFLKDQSPGIFFLRFFFCCNLYVCLMLVVFGHKQWWTIKSKNFDTVLLFKVGKFYETYHMDAIIAVECLGLTFMRGGHAHAGFPEAAYGKFADQLVSRGYKVARIEQTETPQQLEERNRAIRGGKEKVVRRSLHALRWGMKVE
ncbi:unnamed protein product, partial [Strongylus vulgaris]